MFRRTFLFTGLLLLAGAVVSLTAQPALAAPHGGHAGFSHGGFNHGGFNHGGFNHGGFNHGGFNHGNFGSFYARPYYGYHNHGYYPYSGYGYSPYSMGVYPSYNYNVYPTPLYGGSSTLVVPEYPDTSVFSPPAPAPALTDTTARVIVRLPANAELSFEGTKVTGTGSVREFESPALKPGYRYTYEVRAQWVENGKTVTQTQSVGVKPRAIVNVDFPVAAENKGTEGK
jgi:uncharacterized protein (TIGR03000 family)